MKDGESEMIDRCRLLLDAYKEDAVLMLQKRDAELMGLIDLAGSAKRIMDGGNLMVMVEISATKALDRLRGR